MSFSDGTFQYTLRKSIEVAGCNGEVNVLTFHECGEGYDNYYMKLRKFVLSGMIEARSLAKNMKSFIEPDDDDADGLVSGEEVKSIHDTTDVDHLDESKGVAEVLKVALGVSDDLECLVKTFGHMVCVSGGNPICTANGTRVKEGAWKRVAIEDKIDCAVQYCGFFGIGLDTVSNNESGTAPESPTDQTVL